jgi:dihydroorotate dehydrogenase electron transfer subunit
MPVDVLAAVLDNTHLSDDYSVLHLDAPEIAAAAGPGQFVMVKPAAGVDPLLRRPFSVFEVLRDGQGRPVAITLLNKKVGVGTGLLFDARVGDRVACLGPLGRPFEPVSPPARAWMVAGGVGLAPFATLAAALRARGTDTTLFYGARRAVDLHRTDLFEPLGVGLELATEDGSRGSRGLVTGPLDRALAALPAGTPLRLYACGPTPMMRAVAALAAAAGHRCDVSLEQTMGCGLGGCYSCVVRIRGEDGRPHFVRSCVSGPVFDSRTIVWDELGGH